MHCDGTNDDPSASRPAHGESLTRIEFIAILHPRTLIDMDGANIHRSDAVGA